MSAKDMRAEGTSLAERVARLELNSVKPLAVAAEGSGRVLLTLFISGGQPVRVQLTPEQSRRLRRALAKSTQPSTAVDPPAPFIPRASLAERLAHLGEFRAALGVSDGVASSNATSARSSGTSNSASTASRESGAPSLTD